MGKRILRIQHYRADSVTQTPFPFLFKTLLAHRPEGGCKFAFIYINLQGTIHACSILIVKLLRSQLSWYTSKTQFPMSILPSLAEPRNVMSGMAHSGQRIINASLILELCVPIRKQIHSQMNNLQYGSDTPNATSDEEDWMICVD